MTVLTRKQGATIASDGDDTVDTWIMLKNQLSRIGARIRRDFRLASLLVNWGAAMNAELRGKRMHKFYCRNGVILNGPKTLDLAFLFHEIWVDETYKYPGYEIERGDFVIDVGANIGVFAAYAATRAPGVRVLSFEPFPENVEWLLKNIKESHLTNVQVYQQGVAGTVGRRVLQVDRSNWIVHSLIKGTANGEELSVECTTLNEIFDNFNVDRCDFLKLDCEGSEYEILQGASPDTLSRIRRIVGEYHEANHINGTGQELCDFLKSHSFRVDRLDRFEAGGGIIFASNPSFS